MAATPAIDGGGEKSGDHGAGPSSGVNSISLEELEKKYAPFVRADVYGRLGRGELPLVERLRLYVAAAILVPIRFVLGMTLLITYYVVCWVCTSFVSDSAVRESRWRKAVVERSGMFLSRVMLLVFGFYHITVHDRSNQLSADVRNDESTERERPGAIVSNHISYVDILYHMSASYPSFVAKRSVAKLPLVGLISQCLRCIFVQREDKSSDFKGVSGLVTERIREACGNEQCTKMLLFPEGTTTNGNYLLPFKTGAFLAKAPVSPVILRYPYTRFSPSWESMAGARHVFLLLCQLVNHIEVIRLPDYYPSEEEKQDPRLYANNVRRLMAVEGNLTLSDIGLPEKRIYLAALEESLGTSNTHQKGD